MSRATAPIAAAAAILAASPSARAASLLLTDLDAMALALDCRSLCLDGPLGDACRSDCPAAQPSWNRDTDPGLTRADQHLAELEYWDGGDLTYLCHQSASGTEVVVPAALCESGSCTDHHTAAECTDADGDGIPAWLEQAIGTSESSPNASCKSNADCGFGATCELASAMGAMLCAPRTCSGGSCTAFHVEIVEANAHQVVAHVFYDYSPAPASVLDLKLTYDRQSLALVDSRPLPLLAAHRKSVQAKTTSDGTLRLVVLDAASPSAVPRGAIIELVFQRTASTQSTIAFTTNAYARTHALAPSQGEAQSELMDDRLWGSASVAAQPSGGPRLLLSYAFDDASRPLQYSDSEVLDADGLCSVMLSCAGATDSEKARAKQALQGLQRGTLSGGEFIDGVTGRAIYLAGSHDHLRMPVFFNSPRVASSQAFTVSGWFYAEGDAAAASSNEQLLFSHNNHLEQTQLGLVLTRGAGATVDVAWLEGSVDDPLAKRTPVATGIPVLTWTHFAVSVGVAAGEVKVYLDGALKKQLPLGILASEEALACPKFDPKSNNDLKLHEFGKDVIGAKGPEFLYVATSRNGQYGIERMDLDGIVRTDILRDGEHSFEDPDYSPETGKIVYASNASGAYEIWVAGADGTNPRQVTSGFGDTSRGIFARRPRWDPNGTAIVFESNLYDVEKDYNLAVRGYRLYYLAYDPAAASGNGAFVPTQLNASALLGTQTLADYCLTPGDANHSGAHWFAGREGETRGRLLFTQADDRMRERAVKTVAIPQKITDAKPDFTPGLSFQAGDEVTALAAYRATKTETARVLVRRTWPAYEASPQYALSAAEGTTLDLLLTYSPPALDPECWDRNHNRALDREEEDMDGDGKGSVADCHATEERNLFLAYDPEVVAPELALSLPGAALAPSAANKVLELRDVFISGRAMVRVDVRSPYNATPFPANGEIAELVFRRLKSGDPAFALKSRVGHDELYIKDLLSADPPALLGGSDVGDVLDARFAPEGDSLVLTAIVQSRPTLLRTAGLTTLAGSARITIDNLHARGLDWSPAGEAYYPCNWMGAYRRPDTGQYLAAFRGGLDEVRVFNYVREPEGIGSEAARGIERLAKDQRREVASRLPRCVASDLECPPYHLCEDGSCIVKTCDATDPYGCPRGLCTLQPLASGGTAQPWVCSAECNYDPQCFQKQCLNGPCRFCDDTLSCAECRWRPDNLGGFTLQVLEGCPDSNSYSCDAGNCRSECYGTVNGQSVYLCDRDTEYCRAGRCLLLDWDWTDFAPASFSGLDEARYSPKLGFKYTQAISQLNSVEIQAYGTGDYGRAPSILVEGRVSPGPSAYGDAWFELGLISVYNTTEGEAKSVPYVLLTGQKITDVRLRLVVPPYDNLTASAGGLGSKDKDFCLDDAQAWADGRKVAPDFSPCSWRFHSSAARLGYPAEISPRDVSGSWCVPPACGEEQDKYLRSGESTVIVTKVSVNGTLAMNQISSNLACSYEGATEPYVQEDSAWRRRRLVFGNAQGEQSPLRDQFCATHACPAAGWGLIDYAPSVTTKQWGLLNCSFVDPADPAKVAGLVFSGITIPEVRTDGAITETANGCTVSESNSPVKEPCYEWMADASLDPFNADSMMYRTVELSSFKSFGY